MSTESEKAQQVTTEHVVMTLVSACHAAESNLKYLDDGHSQHVLMIVRKAIKEGEQWLAR